jgi:hypothetical protein
MRQQYEPEVRNGIITRMREQHGPHWGRTWVVVIGWGNSYGGQLLRGMGFDARPMLREPYRRLVRLQPPGPL